MKRYIYNFLVIMMLASWGRAYATITSVVLTPQNPTFLSMGNGYYLAGKTYTFTVQVVDPDLTAWNQITEVVLTIPNSTNIQLRVSAITGTGAGNHMLTIVSGTVACSSSIAGTWNNFTVTFNITFQWNTQESAWALNRNIVASATTTVPANNTVTDTKSVSYGVCASIRILNFAQDGVASDGMINPWHSAFNVTGTIVYNVPGAAALDAVHLVADALTGEITNAELLRNGIATVATDGDESDGLTLPVPLEYFFSLDNTPPYSQLGNHTWTVRITCSTPGGPEVSINSLTINCDVVEITNIEIINGGGLNASPNYWRSVAVPGTQVRVTARLQWALTNVVGNTTVRIQDSEGNNTDVLIPNGQPSAVANITYPTVTAQATDTITYQAISITGGAHDDEQNGAGRIPQVATRTVYWDNADPPGANTPPFTTYTGHSQTATTITVNWGALNTATVDGDFDSYRIYYRESPAGIWFMVDRTIIAALGNAATTQATITGLTPLTNYDIRISAVDVFGYEVALVNRISDTISTTATSIEVSITDGITEWGDTTFGTVASNRPVRKTAIRVNVRIVSAADLPETVNIIVAQGDIGVGVDLIAGGVINPVLTEGVDYYRITTSRIGPNTWVGYIPDTNTLITIGNDVRFIIETIKSGITTYTDSDSESESPPGNPNDFEYSFAVTTPTQFTPWPTRILNNVITDKNPTCYPAYYLTDDAYVDITVYDIKGRPVAKLLDNAFRKGGQNIKEGGWSGTNKANNKLGVGLYYIHIRAKRVSDGKIILNSFQKVVIAK
ncbi:MAG: fibronectin type III domain-containing protein [Spirochaetota bacterium]